LEEGWDRFDVGTVRASSRYEVSKDAQDIVNDPSLLDSIENKYLIIFDEVTMLAPLFGNLVIAMNSSS
jgi:hypothetical protein